MSNLFSTKTGRQEDNSYTGKVLSAVRGVIADARNSTSLTEVSKSLGLESMTESQIGSLNTLDDWKRFIYEKGYSKAAEYTEKEYFAPTKVA
jgi:hypothetical protein